jgi:hypothetical protein
MAIAEGLFTVAGMPAHPLLVDAVAVLLPLAAVCAVALVAHRRVRRRFGLPVLALTGVAVLAVPFAEATGKQLAHRLATHGAALARHEALGNDLLPYALGFGVTVLLLVVSGKLADRERAATIRAEHERAAELSALMPAPATPDADATPTRPVSRLWRRTAVLSAVLVVGMAVATTVQVVRIGTTGAQAVWQAVGH